MRCPVGALNKEAFGVWVSIGWLVGNKLDQCFSNNLCRRMSFLNFQIVMSSHFCKNYKNKLSKKIKLKKYTSTNKAQDQPFLLLDSIDIRLFCQIIIKVSKHSRF